MARRFEGKRILITGGTSGMGLAAARRIAEEGGSVTVTGLTEAHLKEARNSLPAGSQVLSNDAAAPAAAERLAAEVAKAGRLDGIWFNAGHGLHKTLAENTAEFFDRMMHTNVRGPVLQMAALQGHLAEGGAVLISASVSPLVGLADESIYAATKAANAALARCWATELADRGIRANAIAPGPIDTRFLDNVEGMDPELKKTFPEMVTEMVPLGRFGRPEEAAAVACFLLSDDASYVTGSQYVVDGGVSKR